MPVFIADISDNHEVLLEFTCKSFTTLQYHLNMFDSSYACAQAHTSPRVIPGDTTVFHLLHKNAALPQKPAGRDAECYQSPCAAPRKESRIGNQKNKHFQTEL